ncbi:Oxidoreductase 2OG-Fe(II) oxygenase family [Penicillium verrucosum]|uniref:Oxidoreductase 2OG-Fe(II) oxygenase family n=1 Tax=Penicillium verrucosum TaxID=60171 RepID=UPI00254579ED|nr:Oxidoreductase 2OG-Fe(II) oxygenase family [Penicillium verrucosum]KAJ5945374.1 Oxidoreductase 2OG-Fe(II) oxygenase family [Penicillium verrucosum]
MAENFTSIPTIDFSQASHATTKPAFLSELRNALVKQALPGYSGVAVEKTATVADQREAFICTDETPAPGPEEPEYRNLRDPNLWPDEITAPGFRAAVEAYLTDLRQLSDQFKFLVAEALDIETEAMGSSHQGLEVQNKAGTWIPVPPVPDTLVINIGLIFESLTGGVCTATTHRVDLRKRNYIDNHGNSLGPRLSFAFFQSLGLDLRHEDVSLNVPSHIADLVKDEKVKSDAETFLAKDSEGCLGRTIFTGTLTTHTDIGERWYPGSLAKALERQRRG